MTGLEVERWPPGPEREGHILYKLLHIGEQKEKLYAENKQKQENSKRQEKIQECPLLGRAGDRVEERGA